MVEVYEGIFIELRMLKSASRLNLAASLLSSTISLRAGMLSIASSKSSYELIEIISPSEST